LREQLILRPGVREPLTIGLENRDAEIGKGVIANETFKDKSA